MEAFHLDPVGRVESGLVGRDAAPRQPDEGAPPATLVFEPRVADALRSLAPGQEVLVVTWLHLARRDVLSVRPRDDPGRAIEGVFTTRSPDRPNPIGLHRVRITAIDGLRLDVAGLEAVHGTPVIDVKPILSADVAER